MKIKKVDWHHEDGSYSLYYMCPGCKYVHAFSDKVHTWNGDVDKPTITPSLLNSNPQQYHTCHSYITDAKIQFLEDCWHDLKGQTVELPELEFDEDGEIKAFLK